MIPRELLDRTWNYLHDESGAPTSGRRDPVGHTITVAAVGELADWLQDRMAFVAHRGAAAPGPSSWSGLVGGVLPERQGARPAISHRIPQQQISDNAPAELQERLFASATALSGVTSGPSAISVPGARGFVLVYGPRDDDELAVVTAIVETSHAWASGAA